MSKEANSIFQEQYKYITLRKFGCQYNLTICLYLADTGDEQTEWRRITSHVDTLHVIFFYLTDNSETCTLYPIRIFA